MDLFGPSRTPSLGGKSYAFVIVDDFSRYTWVLFLSQKNETFYEFSKFCNKVQNEKGFTITCIRSDHGREFENIDFEDYCNEHGIYNDKKSITPVSPISLSLSLPLSLSIHSCSTSKLNKDIIYTNDLT